MSSVLVRRSSSRLGSVFEGNVQLAQELRLEGVTQLAVTGVQSDCCVRSSILGAIASGFEAQDITLLQGAHSTLDDASAGKSYSQIKKDVEEELAALGVRLEGWQSFRMLDV
jgi:nicotinamidase-related amidase